MDFFRRYRREWLSYDDPDPLSLTSMTGLQPEGFRTDSYRRWQPRIFTSLQAPNRQNRDKRIKVADVAYATATPPGFRELRYGLGDGGVFNSNPAPHAFARVGQYLRWNIFNHDVVPTIMPLVSGTREQWSNSEGLLARIQLGDLGNSAISMLSVGDGAAIPYYWPPTSGLGPLSFWLQPVNPMRGIWHSLVSYVLQASDESANLLMRELMGWNYFRLNPPIVNLPAIPAALLSRFPSRRRQIISAIYRGIRGQKAQEAFDMSLHFLNHRYLWADDSVWTAIPMGPIRDPEIERKLYSAVGDGLGSAGVFGRGDRPG